MRWLAMLAALVAIPATAADNWQILQEDSSLTFEATQQGGTFDGGFERFSAEMRFSADDLANSGFDVTVDVTSIDTGSRQRDRELPKASWFHFDEYPEATFRTTEIRAVDGGYEAVGDLTIRGNTHEIVLPFTWETQGDTARMDGEVTIDRTRYGVGQGDWEDPDAVGHEVTVIVDLTLERDA
ncbi:YceI family protein [Spiribacter halobius]|uniref:YceI family protein n=1 Tax=Sediminicurvatus halobius TaxID=2182432 RepID=A0A2U2N796_9GAMM|nr:YceI family protein [Spiribacter halobius]PWG64972.1 YceI family protein [Spiribacter halobius]UEX78169.1 YceI family protein [Spiribacter halobius]